MSDKGIKASGTVDVLIAADKDLAFSSQFNHPKIWKSGKISGTSEQITNDFGYPVRFIGYILGSGKYFVHYNKSVSLANFGFESSNYGEIRVDSNNIILSADSANTLIYIAFVNPSIDSPSSPGSLTKGNIGFKFTKTDDDVLTAADYLKSLSSEYQMLKVVQEGDVTVTADAISASPVNTVEKTNIVDVNHTLIYAAHVIVFDERSKATIAHVPFAVGLGPDHIISDTEVYIDSSKIRFRVSRLAESQLGPISDGTADFKFHYLLTDYRLPT